VPIAVVDPGPWATIWAGFQSSYGIKQDGTLWAWGSNQAGRLGLGDTVARTTPTQVGTDTDWAAFPDSSAAYASGVAAVRKKDGSLHTMGGSAYGALGRPATDVCGTGAILNCAKQPGPIALPGKILSFAFTNSGLHVVRQEGGPDSELGSMWRTQPDGSWVRVGVDADWRRVYASNSLIYALKRNWKLYTWGPNGVGQLGVGDLLGRSSPTYVPH
jgi:hypothetical protein